MTITDLIRIDTVCPLAGIGLICGLSLKSLAEAEAMIFRCIKVALLIVVVLFAIATVLAGWQADAQAV